MTIHNTGCTVHDAFYAIVYPGPVYNRLATTYLSGIFIQNLYLHLEPIFKRNYVNKEDSHEVWGERVGVTEFLIDSLRFIVASITVMNLFVD